MTDIPIPDRLSIDPDSPHYDNNLLEQGIGVKLNGAEKINVEEYCISEGWIRLSVGKSVDGRGLDQRRCALAYLSGKARATFWFHSKSAAQFSGALDIRPRRTITRSLDGTTQIVWPSLPPAWKAS